MNIAPTIAIPKSIPLAFCDTAAPGTNVAVWLGEVTVPVPVLFLELPPEPLPLPVVELEAPCEVAGPGFVTLKKLPAKTLFASPACVNVVKALKPCRFAAALLRAERFSSVALEVSTTI